MSKRALLLFCVLVYALAWSAQFAIIAKYGNPENGPSYLLAGIMFAPALVTLLFAAFHRPSRKWIRWKPTWRMLPLLVVAFLVPTVIAFATVAAVEGFHWGHSSWFVFSPGGVAISGGPWLLGRGTMDWPRFVANVVLTGGAYAAMNAVVAMGEELGWRGFLQGPLVARLGTTRGLVLLGLIWSFWHLPSLLAGYNFPEHPVLGGFVLFPIELVAISMFLGWLALRSGSFWAAAVAHGAGNSIEVGVVDHLRMNVPHIAEDLLRLGATVIVGLVFWALLRRSEFSGTKGVADIRIAAVQPALEPAHALRAGAVSE